MSVTIEYKRILQDNMWLLTLSLWKLAVYVFFSKLFSPLHSFFFFFLFLFYLIYFFSLFISQSLIPFTWHGCDCKGQFLYIHMYKSTCIFNKHTHLFIYIYYKQIYTCRQMQDKTVRIVFERRKRSCLTRHCRWVLRTKVPAVFAIYTFRTVTAYLVNRYTITVYRYSPSVKR